MTLLLTLAAPWAIHQSSDYRLTPLSPSQSPGPDDVAGAKQLTLHSTGLVAQVSFTGVALVGSLKTREWLSEIIARAAQPVDVDLIASEIAAKGTDAIKTLPHDCRMLTVVIAVVGNGKKPRMVMISNMDRFDGPKRTRPLDRLEIYSLIPTRPAFLAFGCDVAVSHNDRRFLISLLRSNWTQSEIKDALAAVNQRAAQNPKSRGLISEACMVTSLLADGSSSTVTFGEVTGIPDNFMGTFNVAEFIREHFEAAPGKTLTLTQSASASRTGKEGYPELLPEGEPRTLHFSTPTSSLTGLGNTFGGEFDKLILGGQSGSVAIRKNEPVTIVLNTVTWEVGQTTQDESGFGLFRFLEIANLPTVEGAQPRDWNYLFNLLVERHTHTLTIHQKSMAFRSANCERPLPILRPNEELVMAAPRNGLTLSASIEQGSITGTIEAGFLLRDFPELGPPTSGSISISLPKGAPTKEAVPVSAKKVGRNDPCPCGSGKKFKRCHKRWP